MLHFVFTCQTNKHSPQHARSKEADTPPLKK